MGNGIVIRNAEEKDINEIMMLENEIWPEGTRATRDKFESRLKFFGGGFFFWLQGWRAYWGFYI